MPLDLAVALGLVAVITAAAAAGWRFARTSSRRKMEVLSGLDGEEVILWVSGGGGHAQLVVPRRGRLQVDSEKRSSVVLVGDRARLVLLRQIRWIEDPKTGRRFDERWHGKLGAR